MIESVNAALTAKFGEGKYVTASFAPIAIQPTTHRVSVAPRIVSVRTASSGG
jgi:hypothetical protein